METKTTSKSLNELRAQIMPPGLASVTSCYVASGKGALLWDVEGREYIDFAGGIAVMNVGHSHPKVVAAVKDQVEKLTHTCFMVLPYEPAVTLAQKLNTLIPGDFKKTT
ncbi:MAG: aminotransferase class III-fold pyridoxal phosphate-dependent enzyme, partial [Desulfobacterales bacterium]